MAILKYKYKATVTSSGTTVVDPGRLLGSESVVSDIAAARDLYSRLSSSGKVKPFAVPARRLKTA